MFDTNLGISLSSQHNSTPVMSRAIVKSNKDPEKRGRIQVSYISYDNQSANQSSGWARICVPYASKESGTFFLPEKGDEVLVYFEDGNINTPIIVGSLYSKRNAPPQSGRSGDLNESGDNDLKYIKTRSGHTLCFDDSNDKKGIVLKDSDGKKLEIHSKDGKIELTDEDSNQLCITKDQITLKNSGGDHVTLKKGKVIIEGASSIELGENAMHKLIKGEMFQAFFNTHTHMTAWGPSTPPMMPMSPSLLTTKVRAT